MSSPPVPVVSPPDPPLPRTLVCANCGAPLAGEYCSACGQRHEPHVHTVTHFAAEAFESVTHADSRLWLTLGYLLAKPGRLTREFFDGRRARYLPPFRLYLVISVVFFLLGMPEELKLKYREPSKAVDSEQLLKGAAQIESAALPDAVRKRTADYLREEAAKAKAGEAVAGSAPGTSGIKFSEKEQGDDNVVISLEGLAEFCDAFKDQAKSDNEFRNNLRDRCLRLAAGEGTSLGANLIHNVPRAMFIFLPLLALVMKLLYWRPKRYYVEHLLFLVHNHAFIFLTASLLILIARVPVIAGFMGWLGTAAGLYMVWYIFRAMRVVYAQPRGLTLLKYFTLGITYIVTSFVMILLTLIYSAMTL